MRIKKIPFVLVMIVSMMKVIGQNYQPNVIPPDPVSAQFQKYLGYPVSHATGIPQINIPLYTMQSSGVDIPFSLSYHASGIKVNEVAGTIGLGWSLFPGFKITRTVMGKPDDLAPTDDIRDLNGTYTFPLAPNTYLEGKPFYHDSYFNYLYTITPHSDSSIEFNSAVEKDGQYDIFSIHLPTINASFILEWENGMLKATTIPEQPITIRPIESTQGQGRFVAFEVTDEQGIVYLFSNEVEYKEYQGPATVSWFLKEINPPGVNNSIHFKYETSNSNVSPYINSSYSTVKDEILEDGIYGYDYYRVYDETIESGGMSIPYNTRSISSIDYDSGASILFQYDDNISSGEYHMLTNMTFKNSYGNIIKSISFSRENKQLTEIISSGDGSYNFHYDNQTIQNPLSQDHLGLYNAKPNNLTLSPEIMMSFDTHYIAGESLIDEIIGEADRTFDPIASQARILKNIVYPTGGQTSFEFEPHVYANYIEGIVCGFGLRVKQINTYDPISDKTVVKSYKYGKNESGVGLITRYGNGTALITDYISTSLVLPGTGFQGHYRVQDVLTQPKIDFMEPLIWYDEVTEYTNGNGKTIFNYDFTPSEFNALLTAGRYEKVPGFLRNIGTGGPRMSKKRIYNENGDIEQEISFQYNTNIRYLLGVCAKQVIFTPEGGDLIRPICKTKDCDSYLEYGAIVDMLVADNYRLVIDNSKLIKTTQIDFLNGSEIKTVTDFTYDNTYKYNLTSKSTTTSTGDVLSEHYYYPIGSAVPDYGVLSASQQTALNLLANNNYSTTLIEKVVEKNGVVLGKELFGYKDWGNGLYKLEEIYSQKGENSFESRFKYFGYDNKGNILSFAKEGQVKTEYIWGYGGSYPVLKVINPQSGLSSSFESSAVLPSGFNSLESLLTSLSDISNSPARRALWNEYNENLRGQNTESMISSYTYKPQVGITSVTDGKTKTAYYHYDVDGKLESVKDQGGNILSQNSYNYSTDITRRSPIPVAAYSGDLYCGGGRTLIDETTYLKTTTYSVAPHNLDFGSVYVGSSKSMDITFTNTTDSEYPSNSTSIRFNSIQLPDGFYFEEPLLIPFSLEKGESITLAVQFWPKTVDPFSGTAIIDSSASGHGVSLSGVGVYSGGPQRILDIRYNGNSISNFDFGTVSGDDFSHETFEIYNTGDSDLSISSIESSDFWTFTFSAGTTSAVIPPGGHVYFSIDFHNAGSESGSQSATITVNSDRTSGNNVLSVSGTLVP